VATAIIPVTGFPAIPVEGPANHRAILTATILPLHLPPAIARAPVITRAADHLVLRPPGIRPLAAAVTVGAAPAAVEVLLPDRRTLPGEARLPREADPPAVALRVEVEAMPVAALRLPPVPRHPMTQERHARSNFYLTNSSSLRGQWVSLKKLIH
jgi:hypothetical protein